MGWNRGLDYNETYKKLASLLRTFRSKISKSKLAQRRFAYLAVLLTQLRNASRVLEALDAVIQFANTGEREVRVIVRKYKKNSKGRKSPPRRLIVIPREIKDSDRLFLSFLTLEHVNHIRVFAVRYLKINTHSLRYALITYLGKLKYPPQIIANITKHSDWRLIQHYTEEQVAEELLINLDRIVRI